MIKRNKIFIIVAAVLLLIFFFPKKSGSWLVSREDDYYCKCFGIEQIFGETIEYYSGAPMKAEGPGNSLCFGIPYACSRAGLYYYFGN